MSSALDRDLAPEVAGKKRRPPCRHGGLESREETPKEGICGRSCRTAAISSRTQTIARAFSIKCRAFHSFERTFNRLLQLTRSDLGVWLRFVFGHGRFKRDQAIGKAGVKLPCGGNTADNRRERQ